MIVVAHDLPHTEVQRLPAGEHPFHCAVVGMAVADTNRIGTQIRQTQSGHRADAVGIQHDGAPGQLDQEAGMAIPGDIGLSQNNSLQTV